MTESMQQDRLVTDVTDDDSAVRKLLESAQQEHVVARHRMFAALDKVARLREDLASAQSELTAAERTEGDSRAFVAEVFDFYRSSRGG